MRGDPLSLYVKASSLFEAAVEDWDHYTACAVWCMCEARWWAEEQRRRPPGGHRYFCDFPWEQTGQH